MATATISAATLALLGVIALIAWAVVYWKLNKEKSHVPYLQLKAWHYRLSGISLTLLGLSVVSYIGLHWYR
jgi:hypothetical protein